MTAEERLNQLVAASRPLRLAVQTLNAMLLPLMAFGAALVIPRALEGPIVVVILLAYGINTLIGAAIHSRRPYKTSSSITLLQRAPWTEKSFPSDHAMLAFFLAGMIAFIKPQWAVIALGSAFVVASCRIAVGVHKVRDVAVGALLGIGWVFVCLAVL